MMLFSPQTAKRFNERYPVGTRVRFWPGKRGVDELSCVTVTTKRAWSEQGLELVSVKDFHRPLPLTHVEVLTDPELGLELPLARTRAEELLALLSPACERAEIAGSVRRGKAMVKDLEIVAVPKIVTARQPGELFAAREVSALDQLLERETAAAGTAAAGPLTWDEKHCKNGPRYKRLRWHGSPVDLFLVLPPASWGMLLLLRTGPADFSKAVVTQRIKGGLLPNECRVQEGALWRGRERIPTPEEDDVFGVLGVAWMPPEERTVENLKSAVEAAQEKLSAEQRAADRRPPLRLFDGR